MKPWSERPFSQVIRLRIRVLWGVIALMLVYMVAVAELGGGDSRRMTDLAQFAYRAIFFGGLAYAIARLVGYKKMLRDRLRLREQLLAERDERHLEGQRGKRRVEGRHIEQRAGASQKQ